MRVFKQELLEALRNKVGPKGIMEESDISLKLDERYFNNGLHYVEERDHKSLVFSDRVKNVIKAYISPGTYRRLPDIERSYETSYSDNPDLFPEAHKAGEGRVIVNGIHYRILFIWQQWVGYPRMNPDKFNKAEWERSLAKWDRLIERNRAPYSQELMKLHNQILDGDVEAFRTITKRYYDSFSIIQASFAVSGLKLRDGFEFLRDFKPPEPSLLELSKITGDLAPKHLFSKGPFLAFDLEKYGLGDPAVDLSTALRSYLKKDFGIAERFFRYLSKRYDNSEFMKNIYLGLIGDKGRVSIYPHLDPYPQRSLEPLRKAMDFYPIAKKYFR